MSILIKGLAENVELKVKYFLLYREYIDKGIQSEFRIGEKFAIIM
jgi:hypothetical protein